MHRCTSWSSYHLDRLAPNTPPRKSAEVAEHRILVSIFQEAQRHLVISRPLFCSLDTADVGGRFSEPTPCPTSHSGCSDNTELFRRDWSKNPCIDELNPAPVWWCWVHVTPLRCFPPDAASKPAPRRRMLSCRHLGENKTVRNEKASVLMSLPRS